MGGAVLWALVAAWGVSILVRARPPIVRTPWALWFFLGWCLVSVAWSHWRLATLASITAQVICVAVAFAVASTLTWRRILDALSLAMRWVLLVSLLFEAFVAVVVRHPIVPVWTDYGDRDIPDAFYFSRAELLTGGRIQGLPGNANLLAMVALLVAIAVAVQFAEGRIRRNRAVGWLVLAALVLALTRSSTVLVAALVVVVVLVVALWIRSVPTSGGPPGTWSSCSAPRWSPWSRQRRAEPSRSCSARVPTRRAAGRSGTASSAWSISTRCSGGAGSATGGRASRRWPTWRTGRV